MLTLKTLPLAKKQVFLCITMFLRPKVRSTSTKISSRFARSSTSTSPVSSQSTMLPLTLDRTLQDFLDLEANESFAQIRFEHHEKKRRMKLKQIHEFMSAMSKKSKSNLVTLSLIPKENIQELKKSKGKRGKVTGFSVS